MDTEILERLQRIEGTLQQLIDRETIRDWDSTAEVAKILGRSKFSVREWCRLGRVNAVKRACGRGASKEWMISHEELCRIRGEGLLPLPKY
jgi:hypothetical protein